MHAQLKAKGSRCLFIIMLVVAGCSSNNQRKWTTFVDPDRQFSVNIPHDYRSLTETEETAFGANSCFYLYWRTSVFAIADMDIKLMELSYMDVSKALQRFTNDQLLDSAISFFRERQYRINSHGRIMRYEAIRMGAFPGRYLVACEDVNKADSLIVFVKAYLVGDRLYTIKANGYKTPINMIVVDSFMNSLRILNPVDPERAK